MPLAYLTIDSLIDTHGKTVELSGGGQLGALELGKLESVLEHIQNDDFYPRFEDKLTHLFYSVAKFHGFQDGNKRLAVASGALLLLANGYLYCVARFLREMENVSVYVAEGSIGKELLGDIIAAHIAQDYEDEALKLKLLETITAHADRNAPPAAE